MHTDAQTQTQTHTDTHTHTPFIHSFSLSPLAHSHGTRHWPWDGFVLDPLCPVKHLISESASVCASLWTCNNNLNGVYTTKNWIDQPPSWVAVSVCIPIQAPAIAQIDWFPFVCCLFCTCAAGDEWGGICHILIFLLLTSQFIRWLLRPWRTWVLSLPSLSFFSSLSLSVNSKKTINRKTTKKERKPFLIIKKGGVNDKKGNSPSKLDNEKRVKMILLN